MMSQFPRLVQAALLFDRLNPVDLEAMIQHLISAGTGAGVRYNRVENRPGAFHRLFGNDMMITVEYIGKPAQARVFEVALGTIFTHMTNPNARKMIARHQSHILINVHHGAMPPTGEIGALLAQMNMSSMLQVGQSLDHFSQRLSLCSSLALLAHGLGRASLVHWTTSDHLLEGDTFAKLAREPVPSLLHILPLLSNGGKGADGKDQLTIVTFGASRFIGREIHLAASPLPWQEGLGMILVFLKVAMMTQGYVIPDGEVFGDEDQTFSCGVRHVPEGAKSGEFDGPLYRLELLRSQRHGFTSPAYVPPKRTFDDRTIPVDILEDLGPEQDTRIEDWRVKRQIAEGIGGRLEVREVVPPRNGLGFLRVFGRKKPTDGPQ